MKMLIVIVLMCSTSVSNAGWFGLTKDAPKVLTAKEKATINEGICGCDMGAQARFANTAQQAEYETQIRPLMKEMNASLRKIYNVPGAVMCRGWADYSQIPRGRKTCIATYSNYGDDRDLKTRGESLK